MEYEQDTDIDDELTSLNMFISLVNVLYVANSYFVESIFAKYKKWCTLVITDFVKFFWAPLLISRILQAANPAARKAQKQIITKYDIIHSTFVIDIKYVHLYSELMCQNYIRIKPDFITLFQILFCFSQKIVKNADEPFWFSREDIWSHYEGIVWHSCFQGKIYDHTMKG